MFIPRQIGSTRHNLNLAVKDLFRLYRPSGEIEKFSGVSLNELSKIEKLFRLNINVWELAEGQADPEMDAESESEPEMDCARNGL